MHYKEMYYNSKML